MGPAWELGTLLLLSAGWAALSSLACKTHVSVYQQPGLTGLVISCCSCMLIWLPQKVVHKLRGALSATLPGSQHESAVWLMFRPAACCLGVSMMLLVPAGLAVLESQAGNSSRAEALYEGAREVQEDHVPLLHARAQELRRQGDQEVRRLWPLQPAILCVVLKSFYFRSSVIDFEASGAAHALCAVVGLDRCGALNNKTECRKELKETSHCAVTRDFAVIGDSGWLLRQYTPAMRKS